MYKSPNVSSFLYITVFKAEITSWQMTGIKKLILYKSHVLFEDLKIYFAFKLVSKLTLIKITV